MEYKFMLKGAIVAGALFSLTAMAADNKPALLTGASANMLSQTCYGCHGNGGVSTGPSAPSIAGLSETYFVEVMQGFASGDTPSTIMGRIAKGYSDEEFETMAEHFAKQKAVGAKQKTDSAKAGKGAKLHDKYCEKCHSESGSVADDDAGILAGQWKPYLEFTLADFISGDRKATKKMAKKLKKLHAAEGDAGIEALINYYASKH